MEQLKICIVEDDLDLAEGLAESLELEGHEVEIAATGEAAISRFREQDFDLTFMDVKLPGKNGVESFLEIRALNPEARVMMMTGYSVQSLLDEAMEGGALGVLRKPFDMEEAVNLANTVGKGSKVLLVEDDTDFGASIKEMLEKNGHWVCHCADGPCAIERCRNGGVDIVFLDLHLNGITGLDVFGEIREIDPTLPIVVLTAFAEEEFESIRDMKSRSLNDILRKPVNPDKLLECIDQLKH